MRNDLGWAVEPILASAPFLPAGKGALILALGGLSMLAITAVLSWALSGPPANAVPGVTFRAHAQRRKPAPARVRAVASPKRVPSPTRRSTGRRRKPVFARVMPAPATPTATGPLRAPGTDWIQGIERAVDTMRLGRARVTVADAARCVLLLDDCQSCLRSRKGKNGCEKERAAIQRAAQRRTPRASVHEKACEPGRNGMCIFEIFRNA